MANIPAADKTKHNSPVATTAMRQTEFRETATPQESEVGLHRQLGATF